MKTQSLLCVIGFTLLFQVILLGGELQVSGKKYMSEKTSSPAFVIENKYFRATLVPERGGRILELLDKKDGKNLVYDSGYGGLLDDHGARTELPYRLEWIKKDKSEVIVRLTLDEEVSYRKTLHFYADKPCIQVDYHCENHGQTQNRMLFRNVVRPGGGTFSDEELYCSSRTNGILHGNGMPYKDELADMWSALIHRGQQKVVSNYFEGYTPERLYSWRKGVAAVAPTYEFMFPPLKQGNQVDIRFYWIFCHGLSAVDYAHRNFVAQLDGSYANGKLEAKLDLAATWAPMPDLTVSCEILDAKRQSIGKVPALKVPINQLDTVLTTPIAAPAANAGKYAILLVKLESVTMDQPVIIEKPFPLRGDEKLLADYKRPVRHLGTPVEQQPMPGWKKETDYTVQASEQDKKRGYLIFEESGAKAGQHTNEVVFDMVQREPEGFPLHFYSTALNGEVSISIETPNGIVLESFIPEKVPEKMWTGETPFGLKLIPGTKFSVKPGEDRTLFFRLTAGDLPPGHHTARIIFHPAGAAPEEVSINVNMRPIRFPWHPFMVFDANNSVNNLCAKKGATPQLPVWDAERAGNFMKDMESHGIRGQAMSGVNSPFEHYWYNRVKIRDSGVPLIDAIKKDPAEFRGTELPRLDFSEWDWMTDQLLLHGMTHIRIQMGNCGDGFMSKHSRLTQLIYGRTVSAGDLRQAIVREWYDGSAVRYFKDRGITRIFAIIDDEIPSEKLAWWVQHAYRSIQMGFEPGVTQSAKTIADENLMNMISPFMKYWVIGTMQKSMMDLRRSQGLIRPEDRVITYHSSANHWQKYDQMRGRCGLDTAFFDLDACWIQTYDRFYSQSQTVVYPCENGPISSAAWEGARDGLDDGNFLLLARAMVAALPDAERKNYQNRLEGIVGMREDSFIRFSDQASDVGTLTRMGSLTGKAFRPYRTNQFRMAKQKLLDLIEELSDEVPVQKASASFGLHPLMKDGVSAFRIPEGTRYSDRVCTFLSKAAGNLKHVPPRPEKVDKKNPYPVFFFGTVAELKTHLPELAAHPDLKDIGENYPAKGNYIIRFVQKPAKGKQEKKLAENAPESMLLLVGDEAGATRAETNLINVITYPRTQYSHWLLKHINRK
jgi:hypothetical protein